MLLSPGARLGPYEILSLLGTGGMGEVYRARDTTLGRDVAIKVLLSVVANDPERLARFNREAQLLASLNHRNIAHIHGLEESGGVRALVMELVEGPTLADRIAQGPVPIAEALSIGRQIADALHSAHEQGIVHRDLKPANIKVREDGTVKVLDFGLAKALAPPLASGVDALNSPTLTAATQHGVILGTAAYMSPEQARGKTADVRADIWAFGLVLFEMLTGRQVFAGESVTDVLASVVRSEPDWQRLPPSAPPAIARLLRACLAKDRTERLQAIGDARIFFDDAVGQPAASPTATRSSPWPWIAVSAVLLSALAALLFVHLRETPAPRRTVTFTVAPPNNTYIREAVISPDATRLVFSVTDRTGQRRLWVRKLDTLTGQSLPGTEGAVRPFWSPDSRFVGFFSGSRMLKADVNGGTAQFIAKTGETTGAGWAHDGTIIVARNLDGLYRVSAGGGALQPFTTLDPARKESRHYWPALLPDDHHFLYLVTSTLPDAQGVWVASLANPADRHRLLPDQTMAAFANGRLIFVRGDALMTQPFDVERLTLSGEPEVVVDRVEHFTNTGFADFSVSASGTITAVGPPRQWRLTWHDRAGKTSPPFGAGGRYQFVSLSPDQTRIAVDAEATTGVGYQLHVIDQSRGTTAQLTFGGDTGNFPIWSPDGTQLAFASNRDGVYDLYVKPSTGAGREEAVLRNGRNKFLSDWSRDGRYLLYGERSAGAKSVDLFVLPITGDRKPVLYLHNESDQRDARFSPDGRWVAYSSDESSKTQVYVQSFPAGSEKVQISSDGGTRPKWRADGRELFYINESGTLVAVDVKTGSGFTAGVPTPLFQTWINYVLYGYEPSRDGQRFVMLAPEGDDLPEPATVILNWTSGRTK